MSALRPQQEPRTLLPAAPARPRGAAEVGARPGSVLGAHGGRGTVRSCPGQGTASVGWGEGGETPQTRGVGSSSLGQPSQGLGSTTGREPKQA